MHIIYVSPLIKDGGGMVGWMEGGGMDGGWEGVRV